MTRTISLLLACSLLAPAVAHALPKPPPVKDGVACHLDLKKTYRVAKVARAGLPLDVTCDGAEDGYLWSEPAFNRKNAGALANGL